MPFKAGDKVVVIDSLDCAYIEEGQVYEVVGIHDPDGYVRILLKNGNLMCYKPKRFKLAEPEVLEFTVGAQVERTGPGTLYTERGSKYIIQTIYRDELGGVQYIKLEGINTRYHVRDFKVVAAGRKAFNRAEWKPQVGEQVFIIGEDEHHVGPMDKYVNDGKQYIITYLATPLVHLENGYSYDPQEESIIPVWAVAEKKLKVPAPPAKKELREALYEKQVARGLGADLCSYAFETADGKQHLYPYICHAKLSNEHGEILKMAYGLRHDVARVPKENREAHKAYATYIITQSPWESAFLTQDIEEAFTKDILMNVEVNRYMMSGACVALRTGQEYPDRPIIFKQMLDLGHDPHVCWLMSCAFTIVGDKYNHNGWTGGHDVIDKYRNLEDVIKFFQTGYHIKKCSFWMGGRNDHTPLTKDPFRTHHGRYAIANSIAKKSDGQDATLNIGHWFEENTVKTVVGEGWNKKTLIDLKALDAVATKLDKLIKG